MLKQKKNSTQLRQGISLVKNIKTRNHPILIKYPPIIQILQQGLLHELVATKYEMGIMELLLQTPKNNINKRHCQKLFTL